MEIHTLLEMPPFQDITEEELLSLILAPEHAHRQYKPADFIAMQGEAYRSLFILCNGSVCVPKWSVRRGSNSPSKR